MKAFHKAKQKSNQHKRKYKNKNHKRKQGMKSVKGGDRVWVLNKLNIIIIS